MITENLSTLKIHKLTQAQYDRELAAGNIDENAIYATPDEAVDLSIYATVEQLDKKADSDHNHDDKYETKEDAQGKLDEAKAYTDTEIAELVGTAPESLDTIHELAKAFEDNTEVIEVLNQAIAQKSDINHVHSWDDLEDKPFYDSQLINSLTWNGDITGLVEIVENSNSSFFKVSDDTPSVEQLIGATSTVYTPDGYETITLTDNDIEVDNTTGKIIADYAMVVPHTFVDENGVTFEKGIYFRKVVRLNGSFIMYQSELICSENIFAIEEIKTLDEKYIPDSIARTVYVDETFARKSDLENIDLSAYETKEESQVKYDTLVESKANKEHTHVWDDLEDKPFGEEVATEVLLDERTLNEEHEILDELQGVMHSWNDKNILLVTVDGVQYECEQYVNSDGTISWGDSRIVFISDGNPDMSNPIDVPFLINSYYDIDFGSGFMEEVIRWDILFNSSLENKEHIIKIEKIVGEKVKTLDEKYISENIARTQYVDENFARKSDIENVDLSGYETKEDAQYKYDVITEAKADWNQSDETALDYIKNRPFYISEEAELKDIVVEIIPETTITYESLRNSGGEISQYFSFVLGKTYIVNFRGVQYECVCYESRGSKVIGNEGIPTESSTGNHEPFLFVDCSEDGVDYRYLFVKYSPSSTITFSITTIETQSVPVIVQLDEKFIPDTIARKTDVYNSLSTKQDKLTGTEGQIVKFNSEGKPVATDLELITVDDIDAICGGSIQFAEEVMF